MYYVFWLACGERLRTLKPRATRTHAPCHSHLKCPFSPLLWFFGLEHVKTSKKTQQMKLITASGLVERLKVNGSLARAAIRELEEKGLIRKVDAHHAQVIYTRATNVEE